MWDPYAEFETAVLPNGLTVYAAHWPNRPWQYVDFIIHAGAKDDPVGLEGLHHFMEHLVSLNMYRSRSKFENFFLDAGGSVHLGSSRFLATQYGFSLPTDKRKLSKAFQLLGEMLLG